MDDKWLHEFEQVSNEWGNQWWLNDPADYPG